LKSVLTKIHSFLKQNLKTKPKKVKKMIVFHRN
jgi:hypothetical protein